jgi:chromosome partitioning protein
VKTLVVMNEKGGVGKTNIVCHAGWYFAEKYRTLVIDLDQQANLTTTLAANLSKVESVALFSQETKVPSVGSLTVAKSTRKLLAIESTNRACIEVFRDSLTAMEDDYDICIIDTPPQLANRTYAGLLSADAVLAPLGINSYSIAGITELLKAIKGVSTFYKRPEPVFLGLLPSLFDRKSKLERDGYEALVARVGKLLFPGIVAKRDLYAKAGSERLPVWQMKGSGVREATTEIRGIFDLVAEKMVLKHG